MESKRSISVEETIQLTEDDIRSLRTYEWSGRECVPTYALPVDITWKYAYHCFQLDITTRHTAGDETKERNK